MYASSSKPPEDLVQPAVQANKEHQYALKVYTERLEAELEHLDRLLAATEVSDDDEEEVLVVNSGGNVFVPGAAKPRGLVPLNMLMDESSPFYSDATRRQRYESFTVSHPMKAQELEALADAVRSENYRLHALEAQARGVPPFLSMDEPPPDFNTNRDGIDWERVAQKVSSASTIVQRTAKECEIRWLGERHPQFSDAQWTQSEIVKVKELARLDWTQIAEKLGTGRTPVDCMRHAITRRTHTWTPDADRRLLEAIDMYGTDSWALVARTVSEDATCAQCQNRYLRTLDPTLKRGPWTPDEDEHLRRAAAVFGHSWVDVAAFVEGRNNEQCRERYQEYLNPSVTKGRWTEAQDSALLKAVEQVGEGKWKEISRVLNIGRTDNMCRLRYTVLMKRNKAGTASPGPSAAASVISSRRSTPAETGGASQILILHPESYYSRSSTSTPAPALAPAPAPALALASESAPTSAPQAKPKPKPRARRKQPTPEHVSRVASDLGAALTGPSTPIQREQPTPETRQETSEPESTEGGSKRPASSARGEEGRPNKRQRTVQPETTATEEAMEHTVIEDALSAAEPAQPEGAQEVETQSTALVTPGRGRGRGRGKGRGRGSGRGRSRPLGRKSDAGRGEEEDVSGDIAVDVSVAQPEPGSSAGPPLGRRSTASAPTRRQPPRAANKASRPETQQEDDAP
ncbi:hypothetical protein LXA43DRAFT_972192 [Ganoderma leucocontextum]|nr:hypothetical protein LXA43DRAFT_972192 [Ganoderma leucocontextum]